MSIQAQSLVLKNNTPKPANVSQNYALVHLSLNEQVINNIQLPWAASTTLTGMATGNYSLAPESISASNGEIYQGSAAPGTFTLTANQTVTSTVNYTLVQPTGKLAINLQTLLVELARYNNNPAVLVTQSQTGTSVTQSLAWNTSTTVSNLKDGATYSFSTPLINYNGANCVTPDSLNFLTNNFKANVVRLSLYVQEDGYETNPTKFTNDMSRLIDEAYNRGIYVIVDWNILNPGDPKIVNNPVQFSNIMYAFYFMLHRIVMIICVFWIVHHRSYQFLLQSLVLKHIAVTEPMILQCQIVICNLWQLKRLAGLTGTILMIFVQELSGK